MGRPRRLLVGWLAVVVVLGPACGNDDDVKETRPVASAATSKTVKWVVDVCSGLTSWLRELQDRAAPLEARLQTATSTAEQRAVLQEFFAETVRSTEAMLDEIDGLPEPPYPGASELAARFRDDLQRVQARFMRAQDEATRAPIAGDAFEAVRVRLVGEIHAGAQDLRRAFAAFEKGEPHRVGVLAAQEYACDFIYDDGPEGPVPAPGFAI